MEFYYPVLLDGATGTQLQERGYDGSICTEQWVLEHPEAICDLHEKYIQAGCQVLYAPTFGANRIKLEEHGISGQTAEYNKKLVEIVKKNAAGRALIAGDMSPTGKFLEPMGDISFEELLDVYTEQAKALEEAGVDLFVIETMMTVSDARAALLAVKSVSEKPVIVTFTCEASGKTLAGADVTALVTIFQGMGADAFGLNCSVGPDEMLKQLQRLHEYAEIPLVAKPNAGMPHFEGGKAIYDCTPEDFTAYTEDFWKAGVDVFGGCCGTAPEHMKALKEKLQGFQETRPEPVKLKGKLPLATETEAMPLDPDVSVGAAIPCDEDLEDNAEDIIDSDQPLITIKIESEDEVENLADCQYALTKPLCLQTEDENVLKAALQVYQGRAMYDGKLPEEKLAPLAKKYGLVY